MRTNCLHLLIAALGLAAGPLGGQVAPSAPNLGYLYPAGGTQGRTVEVLAGGQRLNGVRGAVVTGEGVEVEVVRHYRPVRNLNGDQRKLLTRLLKEREDVLSGKPPKPAPPKNKADARPKKVAAAVKKSPTRKEPSSKAKKDPKSKADESANNKKDETEKKEEPENPPVKLPEHPLLRDIDQMNRRELEVVRGTFQRSNRNQLNPQIAEMVSLTVTIAPGAPLGDRTIRLRTPNGLTNPLCFQVGGLPEWLEQEPNEKRSEARLKLKPLPPLDLPVVVNGQILPGDVDRIRFWARKGESLVVDARARQLIPYLADAVPGWFQMVVTLYDEKGTELAFADDFRFHPDPLMRFVPPADGVYTLEVRDSIFRGRQDFVYRIRIGKVPVITEMFPLGTQQGLVSKGKVRGWNLPAGTVTFDPGSSGGAVRKASLTTNGRCTNTVPYAVDPLPQVTEIEPNDQPEQPHLLRPPVVVNGRIDRVGDADVFQFHGRMGQELVAEVQARRLNSPLDSKLKLLDRRGIVLARNDDFMEKDGHLHMGEGLLTHHADSYLRVTLPDTGPYFIVLGDSQGHGGSAYGYRLRLSDPQPDFRTSVTPSAVLATIGGHTPLRFHIDRQEGFEGDVEIELVDAPRGWRLHGARVPAGCDQVRATLELPRPQGKARKAIDAARAVSFRAVARAGDRTMERPVAPADDRMQAFLWRHLVPAEQFLVLPTTKGWPPIMELADGEPARFVPGTSADVRIVTSGKNLPLAVRLVANEPPPGIVVEDFGLLADGFVLKLKAEQSAQIGLSGNLIIEGWMHPKAKPGKKAGRPYLVGALPAIPFVIVSP